MAKVTSTYKHFLFVQYNIQLSFPDPYRHQTQKKFYKIVARVLAAGHHKEDESGHLNFQSLPLNSWISGLGRGSNVF